MKKRYIISFVVAIIILSVLFLWNVGSGSVDISTSDLFTILAGSGKDETFSQIVWKNQTAAHPCCDLVRRSTVSVGIFTPELFPESDCRTVCAWNFIRRKTGGGAYHDFPAGKRHYDQFLWHGYGCVCGFHACHGIRAFNFISRVKNVAAGGLWDHDRLYLFRHHGLWRHIC